MPEVLKTAANVSDEEIVNQASDILIKGGIIAYPTETFYGLGVDATNEKAIRKIFDVKGRDFRNPIALIIGQKADTYSLVKEVPDTAERLMAAYWPGALTLVFSASDNVSPLLTAGTGKIGQRVSSHPIARKIAEKIKRPLTATSANQSGMPECSLASGVIKQIGDRIDAVLDGGETTGGRTSTIVDVTCSPPAILREGTISRKAIGKYVTL